MRLSWSSLCHITRRLNQKKVKINAVTEDAEQWTALLLAIDLGNVDIARLLLIEGASARMALKNGSTPLHEAAGVGRVEICEMLVDETCDVNALDNNNETPLMKATWGAHDSVVAFLLKQGADPRIQAVL
jgi:ankyrin repeat protein